IVSSEAMVVPILLPAVLGQKYSSSLLSIGALAVKEALIGTILGAVAAILFWAIDSAAEFVDLQRGATSAGVFNPQFGTISSPLSGLFSRLIAAVFYAGGGLLVFIGALLTSYQLFPPLSFFPQWSPGAFNILAALYQNYFQLAVLYAAPLLVT